VSPADQPDIDPVLADAVRRAYVRPVDEATARRHVTAMVAAAASAGTEPVIRRARPRRRVWRSVVATAAATVLAPVGLAVAGVALPDAVEEPYRAVGIELPHQERDAGRAPAPALRPVEPRTPSTPPPPTATSPTTAPRRPADERTRHPRSARPDRRRGKRPVNRGGRENKDQRPGRRRSAAPRQERALPIPRAAPKQKRSKPKRPK
jgi:hypothetical protein